MLVADGEERGIARGAGQLRYAEHLTEHPEERLEEVGHAAARRPHHGYRLMVMGEGGEELRESLARWVAQGSESEDGLCWRGGHESAGDAVHGPGVAERGDGSRAVPEQSSVSRGVERCDEVVLPIVGRCRGSCCTERKRRLRR